MKVVFSAGALRSLADVAEHIRQHDPQAAQAIRSDLRQKARQLGDWPLSFPLHPPFATEGVRRRVVGNYLILYMVDRDHVIILAIRHAARDPELPL